MTNPRLDLICNVCPRTVFSRYWTFTVATAVVLLALTAPSLSNAQPYDPNDPADKSHHYDRRGSDDRGYGRQGSSQGPVVRCESSDRGYRHCPADTRKGVQLRRQLSKSACRYKDSWGYDRRGVWVDQGCRADFQLYTGRSGGDGEQKDKDSTAAIVGGAVALGVLGAIIAENDKNNRDAHRPLRLVRCESDGDYRYCRADFRNRVDLHRQLSRASCRQNQNWGYDRRGVWVDQGCRAEFSLD